MRWSPTFPLLALSGLLALGGCASGRGTSPAAPTSAAAQAAIPTGAPAPTPKAASVADASPAAGYYEDEVAQKRASQLFRAVCTGYCHTTEGAAREAPDLFDCANEYGASDQDIFGVISAGVPDTQMQGFGGKLPDDDLWRIVAYLRVNSTCS